MAKQTNAVPGWYVRLESALQVAQMQANAFGLPQTVFQNPDTCGWANTNPFSSTLKNSEVFASILPANYFSN